jgi:hypothetical protein
MVVKIKTQIIAVRILIVKSPIPNRRGTAPAGVSARGKRRSHLACGDRLSSIEKSNLPATSPLVASTKSI